MPEFVARGTAKFSGVTFFITAQNLKEAKVKAAAGDFVDTDHQGASMDDWEIEPRTVEPNE